MQFDSWGPPKSWTNKQIVDFKKKVFPDRWIKKLGFITDGKSLLSLDASGLKAAGFKTPQAIGMIVRLCKPVLEMAAKAVRFDKDKKAAAKAAKKRAKAAAVAAEPEPWELMDVSEPVVEEKEEQKAADPEPETPVSESAPPTPSEEPEIVADDPDEMAFLKKSREKAKARKAKKEAEKKKKEAEKAKKAAADEILQAQRDKENAEFEAEEKRKADEKAKELAERKSCTLEPTLECLKKGKFEKPNKKMFAEMDKKGKASQDKLLKKLSTDKEWKDSTIVGALEEILNSKNPPPEEDEDLDGGMENWPPGTRVKVMGFDITWNDPLMNGFGKIKYAIHTGMEDNYVIELKDRADCGLATDITVPGYQLDDLVKLPDSWDTASLKCMIECLKGRTKYSEVCKEIDKTEKEIKKTAAKYKNVKKAGDKQKLLTKKKELNETKEKYLDKRRNMVQKIKDVEATTNKTIEWNERFNSAVYVDGITERPSEEIQPILEACGLEVERIGPVEASRNDFKLGCVVYLKNKQLCNYAAKTLKKIDVGEDLSDEKCLKFTQPVPQNMGNVVKAMKYMKKVRGM